MSKDECNSGIAMLSFLTGTVIGAAITLLVAPKTGKEVREMLAGYGEDIKTRTTDLTGEFKSHTESMIDQGRSLIEKGKELINRGTEMASEGKEYFEDRKHTLSAAIEAGKDAMQKDKEATAKAAKKEK